MFFNSIFKKRKKHKIIQYEYIESITKIIKSPLWDGSDEQIYQSLPKDLKPETIEFVKNNTPIKDA